MKKAAVVIAPGFEEGEALTIIDIMRRAGITCDSVGLTQKVVTGAHHITIGCDKVLSKKICDYDMVVLPGGIPGATNLRDSDLLMEVVREMDGEGKYVCAMCAAPIALERAGVLEGKTFTAYVGYDQKIKAGTFSDREVVTDGNVVTSRGPATAYAFAYELAGLLGGDVEAVKQRMLYDHAFKKEGATAGNAERSAAVPGKETGKVAVLMAEGYEEGETLTIVDILRRAEIECHTFAVGTREASGEDGQEGFVKGMHGMMVKADQEFSREVKGYDMIVLPGGRPGGANLRENPGVIEMVTYFAAEGKFVAAMCSGTLVLSQADIIEGRQVTGYTGYGEKLAGAVFKEDVVVADGNLITSQGPATVFPFAYKLAEVLGRDVSVLKERMLYNFAGGQ